LHRERAFDQRCSSRCPSPRMTWWSRVDESCVRRCALRCKEVRVECGACVHSRVITSGLDLPAELASHRAFSSISAYRQPRIGACATKTHALARNEDPS